MIVECARGEEMKIGKDGQGRWSWWAEGGRSVGGQAGRQAGNPSL